MIITSITVESIVIPRRICRGCDSGCPLLTVFGILWYNFPNIGKIANNADIWKMVAKLSEWVRKYGTKYRVGERFRGGFAAVRGYTGRRGFGIIDA